MINKLTKAQKLHPTDKTKKSKQNRQLLSQKNLAPSIEIGKAQRARVIQRRVGNGRFNRQFQLSAQKQTPLTSRAAHKIASRGVMGKGHQIPHFQHIQAAFGKHDISGIQAYTSPSAQQANTKLGSNGFATGNKVAFRNQSPSLFVAAHEAAHVIQQQKGIHLSGGIGQKNDPYERHANQVASRVVNGQSAESLLQTIPVDINHSYQQAQTGHQLQGDLGFEIEVMIPVSKYDSANGDDQPANGRNRAQDWANSAVALPNTIPQTPIWNNAASDVYAVPEVTGKWARAAGTAAVPPNQLEIVVRHFQTANLVNAQNHLNNNVQPLLNNIYNDVQGKNPANQRSKLAGSPNAMIGLPYGNDPRHGHTGHLARGKVSWKSYMQATAGIKLKAIQSTLSKIEDAPGNGEPLVGKPRYQTIAQEARNAATTAFNTVSAGFTVFGGTAAEILEIKGYLSLLGLYLRGGEHANAAQTNANPKNMAPIFLRSAFDQIYASSLTGPAQTWITNNATALRKELFRQLKPSRRIGRGNYRYTLSLFDKAMANPVPEKAGAFAHAVLRGNQDSFTRREAKSLLAPENVNTVAAPIHAPVMEFRKIASPGTTVAQWVAKMQSILTEVHGLNNL